MTLADVRNVRQVDSVSSFGYKLNQLSHKSVLFRRNTHSGLEQISWYAVLLAPAHQ
jgi:hypothetical protein